MLTLHKFTFIYFQFSQFLFLLLLLLLVLIRQRLLFFSFFFFFLSHNYSMNNSFDFNKRLKLYIIFSLCSILFCLLVFTTLFLIRYMRTPAKNDRFVPFLAVENLNFTRFNRCKSRINAKKAFQTDFQSSCKTKKSEIHSKNVTRS